MFAYRAELHNINFSLSIQYQLFYFPSYQYQFQYQLFQRGLINVNILTIIQKFPNQFQYQLIDSLIDINQRPSNRPTTRTSLITVFTIEIE